jgi:peroxiredoxin
VRPSSAQVRPGSTITPRELTTASGRVLAVPAPGRLTHLQFRRFAGCPICNLHLRSIAQRHAEIEAAGVDEVVVFHSPARELVKYEAALPFPLIPDPDKRLYAEFGVESGARSLLDPRVWGTVVRAVLRSAWQIVRGRERGPAARQRGGRLGLPADVLIGPDGRVIAAKYGTHAYDQWPVDEVLRLAAAAGRPSSAAR